MAGQSPELAAETSVMRAFDSALQKALELPPRARGRTLRHISERLAEHLEQTAAELEEYAAGWHQGGPGRPAGVVDGQLVGGGGSGDRLR